MRWLSMVLFSLVLSSTIANPDPKKYKKESIEKDKKSETLTTDERDFLREVEEKYGVKSDISVENNKEEDDKSTENNEKKTTPADKKPLPAVIAIEIVNDTDSQSKGKRTIDANLGYGYRTHNGYTYSYFGKANQDKGKFVIYPYSQEDPPTYNTPENNKYSSPSNGKYSSFQSTRTDVEIQPSQAYELVPIKDEQPSYEYKKPAIEFKTPPSGYLGGRTAQTLYTTYNGQELSGLSGQFPTVMPNYFVDPSQLLQNPHFQSAGLTQDHIRSQGYLNQHQRIVPVLVLRVPSSYLRNPTAELYANLPTNYPLSQHLNSVNLQSLVNQYFKKNGYSFAPNVMTYQNSVPSLESGTQHYSHPYVKPTYTEADYSGVQYSAVKPVMARYPSTYTQQQMVSQPQSVYQNPAQQQYEYQYQYVPQTEIKMQTYYIQPHYQQSSQETSVPDGYQNQQSAAVVEQQSNEDEAVSTGEYLPQYTSGQDGRETAGYEPQHISQPTEQPDISQYVSAGPDPAKYAVNNENIDYSKQQVSVEYPSVALPSYTSSSDYYSVQPGQKNTVSVQPSNLIHTEQYQEPAAPEGYSYSNQNTVDSGKSLVISENYPSKDHTIATVLPYTYKSSRRPTQTSVQAVSYVTPMPTSKYQSKYRIMVPQTVFRSPNTEKVSYVNSHSLPMHYTQVGAHADSSYESEYTAGSQYVSSVASKPSYTRTYHPKRNAKPESKPEVSSSARVSAKITNERGEKKNSS